MALKFDKGTDTEHEVKLDSEIAYAEWLVGVARAGGRARFEVGLVFVGHNSKIEAVATSKSGKTIGKVRGLTRGDTFNAAFDVPDDLELNDPVTFEVELPDHGLRATSPPVPSAPKIGLKSMKWGAEEARDGDVVTLQARLENVADGTPARVIVCEHDAEGIHDTIAELSSTVSQGRLDLEWEYVYHEDVEKIPTDSERRAVGASYDPPEYFFVVEIDGQRLGEKAESGLLRFRSHLDLELRDVHGRPMAKQRYEVTLPDGKKLSGELDDQGRARVDDVPPGRCRVDFPGASGVRADERT